MIEWEVGLGAYSTEVTVTNTTWYTQSVPFGVVNVEGRTTSNGDVSTHTTRLLDYGTSGAHSLITSHPRSCRPCQTCQPSSADSAVLPAEPEPM